MTSFFDYIGDRFSDTNDYVAKSAGFLTGIGTMLYLKVELDDFTLLFSWGNVLSTFLILLNSGGSVIVVLVATDIYKYLKPKTVKFAKETIRCIKIKMYKYGKQKRA